MTEMTTLDRLIKARIQIQMRNPFFSYMSLYLKFQEDKLSETAGIDKDGNLYYNPELINSLTDKEIEGVLIHELLHLILQHLSREGNREHELCNIAEDLCVNWLVRENGYELPDWVLMPDSEGVFEQQGIRVEGIDKKIWEIIYDELEKQIEKKSKQLSDLIGKDGKMGKGGSKKLDKHFSTKGLSEEEKKAIEKRWEERTQEAISMAQMRGDMPVGMERWIKDLHKEKINWRTLLNQYITQQFPYDYSYAKPSKRSVSVGEYMPYQLKEKIELAVCLDLSGSIGDKEYADFMSEIIGIARAYQERCDITFYSHDIDGYDNGLVRNGNIEEIKKIKLKGGGGTDFNNVAILMNKNPKLKSVIWLSDGFGTDIKVKPNYEILWVLAKGGDDTIPKKYGRVLQLND